jgi:flagellar biosynthesis protein FlhF
MKIKTYTHRDMRSALKLVRDEQGPDVVILSSRQLPEGVEVTVGIDPEAALAVQLQNAAPAPALAPAAPDPRLGEELRTMRHLL